MALTLTRQTNRSGQGSFWAELWLADFDNDYTGSGGEALTAADLGLHTVHRAFVDAKSGYVISYDRANEKLIAYQQGVAVNTLTITDDDDAASNGTDVYVHIDEVLEQGSFLAHLESVTAGNADTHFTLGDGGPVVRVQDDDSAASSGLAVYVDEDADLGSRLLADLDNVGDADVFVMASDGSLLRINDVDTASSAGVAVHVDDDGANAHERLLFVSPTDTDATEQTDSSLSFAATGPLVEVPAGTDLSGLTDVEITVLGY